MTYIVVDVEVENDEMIEMGAIKLNSSLEIIGTFQSFIKPTINSKLGFFIKNLTGISQEEIDNANHFPHVYHEFLQWFNTEKEDVYFITWSNSDKKFFQKEFQIHNMEENLTQRFVNIQYAVSSLLSDDNKLGLKKAMELAGFVFEGAFHRAYCDALNTSKLFLKAMNELGSIENIVQCPAPPKVKKVKKLSKDEMVQSFRKINFQKYNEYAKDLTIEELTHTHEMLLDILQTNEMNALYALAYQKSKVIGNVLHNKLKEKALLREGLSSIQLERLTKNANILYSVRFGLIKRIDDNSFNLALELRKEIEKVRAQAKQLNKKGYVSITKREVIHNYLKLRNIVHAVKDSHYLNSRYKKEVLQIDSDITIYLKTLVSA